jgi:hypothetical protein
MVANRNRKPSPIFYVIGFAIIIIGIPLFAILVFSSINNIVGDSNSAVSGDNDLIQLVVPGRGDIRLEKTGKYTIYHEYRSVIDNRVYSSSMQEISGLEIALASRTTGMPIPIDEPSVSSTYSVGSRSGISLFDFNIDEAGTYELSAFYPDGQLEPKLVLAVGHGFVGKIVWTALQGVGILLGTFTVGSIIVIMTFLKRREKGNNRNK